MVAESTELGFYFLLPVGLNPLLSKRRGREEREQMVYIHQRPKGLRLDSGSHLVADSLWQGWEAEKGVHCTAKAGLESQNTGGKRMGRCWEEAGLPSDPPGVSEGAKPARGG